AGAGIAEIERRRRLGEPRNADAVQAPRAHIGALDVCSKGAYGLAGIEHVLAFEQTGNARLADRKRTENERAVRDRFVARHAHTALQRAGTAGGQRLMFSMHGEARWVVSSG